MEIELARQLLAGKPEAFDRFVDHFRAKIFSYSQMMCGHRDDAEEVVQETLLRVFENFGQLREPEHVRAWVFRIAKNACLMKRRKSIYAPQQELSVDELMPARGNGGDPIRSRSLPHDVEEHSTEETAQVLDLNTDAVKTRLHRARLLARKTLDGYLRATVEKN